MSPGAGQQPGALHYFFLGFFFSRPHIVSRTKISEDVKHTFAWTIERFSERQEPNSQFLWSSKFTIRGPDEQVLQSYLMVFFWESISEQFLQLASFMKILQLHVTPWKKNFTIAGDSLEDETVSQGWYSRSSWLLVCISLQPGLPVSIYLFRLIPLTLIISLPWLTDRNRSEGKIRVHNFGCLQEQAK